MIVTKRFIQQINLADKNESWSFKDAYSNLLLKSGDYFILRYKMGGLSIPLL